MILDRILAHKREEVQARAQEVPLEALRDALAAAPPVVDFAAALAQPGVTLIAEVKRASPSKGLLCPDLDPAALAATYVAHGAGAISVLTDAAFFRGSLDDLAAVKRVAGGIPVLRKEFVIDPYQVYEARAWGADAVLLIAAALSPGQLGDLLALTHDLGMEALVEVHNEDELEAVLPLKPRVIGVNNRDLRTFRVDLRTFGRLRERYPEGCVAVAESGIHTAEDVRRVGEMGADAILVGEALVTAPDVAAKLDELVAAGRSVAHVRQDLRLDQPA